MLKKVQVKILNNSINSDIPMPTYATEGSAALDLRACIDNKIELLPKNTILVPTGLAFYIQDKDYAGIILPRSGLGHNRFRLPGGINGFVV